MDFEWFCLLSELWSEQKRCDQRKLKKLHFYKKMGRLS